MRIDGKELSEMENVVLNLQHALKVAVDRAIQNGDRLIKLNESDINRGQFLYLVDNALKKADEALEQSKNKYYFVVYEYQKEGKGTWQKSNTVIDTHPVIWLKDVIDGYNDVYHILFFSEIEQELRTKNIQLKKRGYNVSYKFTGYKSKYDYPNVNGLYTCTKCGKEKKLPANYCTNCGKELEEHQKQGLNK
jgi:DNA-directed RNA polymerase subunit RPC12/RpoP